MIILIGVSASGAENVVTPRDEITIGAGAAAPGAIARVPVYLRDVSQTSLGIDKGAGNRIEALMLKVTHSSASAVASIAFERAGAANLVMPKFERSVPGAGPFGYVAGFSETDGHLPLTVDAAAPGNQIGTLVVTLTPQAVRGSTIVLALDSASAALANARGTIVETVANGTLALADGSVFVKHVTGTTLTSSKNPALAGDSINFTATVSTQAAGTLSGTITFRDGSAVLGSRPVEGGQAILTTSSLGQGSHSISAEYSGDSKYASSTSNVVNQAVNLAPFGPPPVVEARATASTRVVITWTAVTNAVSYEIRRSTNAGPYALVGSPSGTMLTDDGVSPGVTYLYVVRAINGAGTASADSGIDIATTIMFADDPLTSGSTAIKANHILQLRAAIAAVRASAGFSIASFTEAPVAGSPLRAVHIQELRNALAPARAALGLPPITFTNDPLTAGSVAKAAHIEELRRGVK